MGVGGGVVAALLIAKGTHMSPQDSIVSMHMYVLSGHMLG